MSLEQHRFWKLNQALAPYANAEYQRLWPGCEIDRLRGAGDRVHPLDKAFAIDVIIRLPNGMSLTIQEKFRKHDKLSFNQFTLEYLNDPATREEGEWFHLCSDLYFYGYANEKQDGWLRWYLFKVVELKLGILCGAVRMAGPQQNRPPARANFYYVSWSKMPSNWVLASYGAGPAQPRLWI